MFFCINGMCFLFLKKISHMYIYAIMCASTFNMQKEPWTCSGEPLQFQIGKTVKKRDFIFIRPHS